MRNELDLATEIEGSLQVGADGTNLVFCRVFDPDFDAGSFGTTGKDGSADFL